MLEPLPWAKSIPADPEGMRDGKLLWLLTLAVLALVRPDPVPVPLPRVYLMPSDPEGVKDRDPLEAVA
jgi:hypothetical protein